MYSGLLTQIKEIISWLINIHLLIIAGILNILFVHVQHITMLPLSYSYIIVFKFCVCYIIFLPWILLFYTLLGKLTNHFLIEHIYMMIWMSSVQLNVYLCNLRYLFFLVYKLAQFRRTFVYVSLIFSYSSNSRMCRPVLMILFEICLITFKFLAIFNVVSTLYLAWPGLWINSIMSDNH